MKKTEGIMVLIAFGTIAICLGFIYFWSSGDPRPEAEVGGSDLSNEISLKEETQGAVVSRPPADQPNAPHGYSEDDFSFDRLYGKALVDPSAMDDLWALAGFCDSLRSSVSGRRRFAENHTWRQWSERCNDPEVSVSRLIDVPRPLDSQDYRDVLDLSSTPVTGDDSKHPDADLREIIQKSNDHRAVAAAAYLYFGANRLEAWGREIDYRGGVLWLTTDSASKFALDLATLIACRAGRNCDGNSINAVVLCSVTPGCTPGNDIEAIMRGRLSPMEWEMAQRFLKRVGR